LYNSLEVEQRRGVEHTATNSINNNINSNSFGIEGESSATFLSPKNVKKSSLCAPACLPAFPACLPAHTCCPHLLPTLAAHHPIWAAQHCLSAQRLPKQPFLPDATQINTIYLFELQDGVSGEDRRR
jgi:hypothetical protein